MFGKKKLVYNVSFPLLIQSRRPFVCLKPWFEHISSGGAGEKNAKSRRAIITEVNFSIECFLVNLIECNKRCSHIKLIRKS